jgi:hypothetical protein
MTHWTPGELRAMYGRWPSDYGVTQYCLHLAINDYRFRLLLAMIEAGRVTVMVVPVQPSFRGMWN